MAEVNLRNIKTEILIFLRNQDIFTITQRGVTTTTDEFDGDNSETEFTLTHTNVKNVRSVTVGGVAKTFGTDYLVDYSSAKITFTTAPGAGTDNVDIQYDYGNTDKIFADFPQIDLKPNDMPRIGFDIIGGRTEETALGGGSVRSFYLSQMNVWDLDGDDVEDYHSAIKKALLNNRKNFYYFHFISPVGIGAMIPPTWSNNKILGRTQDWEIWSLNETG